MIEKTERCCRSRKPEMLPVPVCSGFFVSEVRIRKKDKKGQKEREKC